MAARVLLAAALAASGCTSSPGVGERSTLPFTVVLREVSLPPSGNDAGDATTPASFLAPGALRRELAAALSSSGVFSWVDHEPFGSGGAGGADLVIDIAFENADFGPGSAALPGAIFSTLAWLFAGPASWWIEDVRYDESAVVMNVEVHAASPGGDAGGTLFRDVLTLKGLELSFIERAGTTGWLLNLIVPPCFAHSDPRIAGRSLAGGVPEFFASRESARLLANFPSSYFRELGCFLSFDAGAGELLVVGRESLTRLRVIPDSGPERELGEDALDLLAVERAEKDALWREFSERVRGLGVRASDRYYRVPLLDAERGTISLRATLKESGKVAAWTIRRDSKTES